MIENIVINGEPFDPTATTTPQPIPWELIVIGGGVGAAVIMAAVVFLRRR